VTADQYGRCTQCKQMCVRRCDQCDAPVFTMLGGMRMLARSLFAHYEIDYEGHDALVGELADILGEEMLSMGRDFLVEHALMEDPDQPVTGISPHCGSGQAPTRLPRRRRRTRR
jgi:hypothetical protein